MGVLKYSRKGLTNFDVALPHYAVFWSIILYKMHPKSKLSNIYACEAVIDQLATKIHRD